ncbi:unnamed protein product [Cutaneotrichosporon oleaginosum]
MSRQALRNLSNLHLAPLDGSRSMDPEPTLRHRHHPPALPHHRSLSILAVHDSLLSLSHLGFVISHLPPSSSQHRHDQSGHVNDLNLTNSLLSSSPPSPRPNHVLRTN